jgi:pantoate--beta-alanine ligase
VEIFYTVNELRAYTQNQKALGMVIGFVPTMGALHQGHLSLIARSKAECNLTLASIFVNPTQFNDPKDYYKYPRMTETDGQMLREHGCDILFLPSVDEMYQHLLLEISPLNIGYLDTILEGAKRPGHYQGVATIVEKLFLSVQPDKVYLGLKDFQQIKVIEKLIRDKYMPIKIVSCPTLREPNGLAMSSRNMRLSEDGKQKAGDIYQVLDFIQKHRAIDTPEIVLAKAKDMIASKDYWDLEYLELRHAKDLSEIDLKHWQEGVDYVALYAGWLEGVRLIDNLCL